MNEKYEIQGDESEVDGRNSNQGNKGIRNNEDIIKLTQNGVDKNGEGMFNQDEDETSANSDDKNDEERFSLINNNNN
jgi:16S rRNA U516 pseudouridylate synthase RsuA-like enzyme